MSITAARASQWVPDTVVLALGQSADLDPILEICERYGGGGHPRVGAISFEPGELSRARQVAAEIKNLRESDRNARASVNGALFARLADLVLEVMGTEPPEAVTSRRVPRREKAGSSAVTSTAATFSIFCRTLVRPGMHFQPAGALGNLLAVRQRRPARAEGGGSPRGRRDRRPPGA